MPRASRVGSGSSHHRPTICPPRAICQMASPDSQPSENPTAPLNRRRQLRRRRKKPAAGRSFFYPQVDDAHACLAAWDQPLHGIVEGGSFLAARNPRPAKLPMLSGG